MSMPPKSQHDQERDERLRIILARQIYAAAHIERTNPPFTLRSGATSTEYFDKYRFESDPVLLEDIAHRMIKDLIAFLPAGLDSFDLIAGLEMGGIPLATILSAQTTSPALFVRKKAKEHGTAKYAEGPDFKGKQLLIVEDIVTSGGQICDSVAMLRNDGARIKDVLCVIDREQGGAERLKKSRLNLWPLYTWTQLKEAVGD